MTAERKRHVVKLRWALFLSALLILAVVQARAAQPAASLHEAVEAHAKPRQTWVDNHPPGVASWHTVGQVGGPTSAVSVQGQHAYVGVGLRLVVLDVTSPVTATELGATMPFPHFVEDVAIAVAPSTGSGQARSASSGQALAYVAAGGAGLRIVDVSDPAGPVEVGGWDSPGYAEAVAFAGDLVYLADGPYGLRIVDVSDPANPAPVSAAYDMNYARDVAVAGEHAFVAAAGAGLLVVDVSDPAQPVEMGTVDTPGYAYAVAVSGDPSASSGQAYAYVADGWGGLHVIDVTDTASSALLATCTLPGWALDVVIEADTAFVAAGGSGLAVVDVSDPAHPQDVGALGDGGLARRVAISGDVAYVADLTYGLLQIDVTALEQPHELSRHSPFVEARYVAVAGSYAYVAAGFSGLRVVDVSDPVHPFEVGAYDADGTYATGVVVSGTVAYVPTYISGISPYDLHIVDISDPHQPIRVGTLETDGVFREVVVRGTTLYAADEHGLRVVDVADHADPREIGYIELTDWVWPTEVVDISGTLAYVGVFMNGLQIVDVSDPGAMQLLGTFLPPQGVNGVTVSGSNVFVSSADGLHVVDVSNPYAPFETGYLESPGYPMMVTISGTLVFLGDGGGGVQVVDVSNPGAPALVGDFDTSGFAWQATLSGGSLFVADSKGGLVILDQGGGSPVGLPLSRDPLPWTALPTAVTARRTRGRSPSGSAASAGCIVTSTADAGAGTLRCCIGTAVAGDTIAFDPLLFDALNPVTITLLSPLPALAQGHLTIDASIAGVILEGKATPPGSNGLVLESDGNTVKGLQVVGFPSAGISISGDAAYNQIGGSRSHGSGPLGEGNLLSRNGDAGLTIGGTGAMSNTIVGNLIGTNVQCTAVVGNGNGISLGGGASHNTIGSPDLDRANVIAGSGDNDVAIWGVGTSHNVVLGNLIGTDASGNQALGPSLLPEAWSTGVHLHSGASHNTIGPGNVINATMNAAVQLFGEGTDHNAITGNFVGTNRSGEPALGNLAHGIALNWGPQDNCIGPGNHIAYNGAAGVIVGGATTLHNTITANAIHDNTGQGIELSEGGNGALAAPVIVSAEWATVTGTAVPGATVEVFSGADDEGQNYEGSVVAGASGAFTFTAPSEMIGHLATATATDAAGNTSEFSVPVILWSETHTVTSALDAGPGSLRQALTAARTGDTITFDTVVFDPQDPLTITLLTDLPVLDQGQMTIDASQAGVVLDGHRVMDNFCGMWIASDGNAVRGLQFTGFANRGLCVDGKTNVIGGSRAVGDAPTGQGNQFGANNIAVSLWGEENTVVANLVGTDVTGSSPMGNFVGVEVQGRCNRIGGPTPGERNIISGNISHGIMILGEPARFNVVAGNYIGTDITGMRSVPNQDGVTMEIRASDNVVGGTTAAERNLISGNTDKGVLLSDAGTHNAVIGNWIGPDATGTEALGNNPGIHMGGVAFNRIGGSAPGEGNVISGNRGTGIDVAGYEYSGNVILGNLIGVTPEGTQPLGNGIGVGLHVNVTRHFVGGTTPAEGNVIGGNGVGVLVSVAGTEYNWILGNSIGTDAASRLHLGNTEAGVAIQDYAAHTVIQGNAVAYNGGGGLPRQGGIRIAASRLNTIRRNSVHSNIGPAIELCEGGNDEVLAPTITALTPSGALGTACPDCTVELFSDDEDEGRAFEGTTVAGCNGDWTWEGNPGGPFLTATTTDGHGNTSAFSAPHLVAQDWVYLPLVVQSES